MRRTTTLALLGMVTLTGCGPQIGLSLSMRPVSVTVPRHMLPVLALVPPSQVIVPVPVPPLPAPPPVAVVPTTAPPVTPPPIVLPPNPCPVASEFAVPAQEATALVSTIPRKATYTLRSTGGYVGATTTPGTAPLTNQVAEVVTPLPSTTSVVGQTSQNWLVTRTDTVTKSVETEAYQLVEPGASIQAEAAGIYLTRMTWNDPVRGPLSFAPGSGVEIMPLPVNTSQTAPVQFASSQTDAQSFTTMSLTGNVLGRQRVDLCGTVVDSYTVELSGTLTTPSVQRQFSWRKQVATQFGGLDVEDLFGLSTPGGGFTWQRQLKATTAPAATS